MKKHLIMIMASEINLSADGTVPEWITLWTPGLGRLKDGIEYLVDQQAAAEITADLAAGGTDIVIDYEHKTLTGDPAPAAGWIKEMKWDPNSGLMARVEWTDIAAAMIARREYRYHSPVFIIRKSDSRVVRLHSLALTNTPRTADAPALAAKLGLLTAMHAQAENQTHEEGTMLKKLIAKLQLAEASTEDQVMAALEAALAAKPQTVEVVAKDIITALELTDGSDASAVVASIHALKQAPKGMVPRAEFDALKNEIAGNKAIAACDAALKAGKITPDQKEWALEYARRDLPGFSVFVSKAPVVVPVNPLPEHHEKPGGPVSAETLAIAKQFGNSEEDLKKYGMAQG